MISWRMRKNISKDRAIAQRTCAACRQVKDKRAMVRLVRTPSGAVEIDISGKREGRGAYLCHNPACWEKVLKSNCLEYALKGKINRNDLEQLYKNGKDLLKELTSG
jgi:predicted RNA-binding protein YlxR (DUF448 family)